jgi:hypothetical protein
MDMKKDEICQEAQNLKRSDLNRIMKIINKRTPQHINVGKDGSRIDLDHVPSATIDEIHEIIKTSLGI